MNRDFDQLDLLVTDFIDHLRAHPETLNQVLNLIESYKVKIQRLNKHEEKLQGSIHKNGGKNMKSKVFDLFRIGKKNMSP